MNVKNRTCIRRLSFRTLWASRRRNVIAVAAIALTALLFTSLFTVTMSINSSYETYTFHQIGAYNHGSFKDVTEEQADAISAHPKVRAAGKRTVIGIASDGVFAKSPAEVSFMDANCSKWCYAQPDIGHMPQKGKEITMDTAALELLGVSPQLGAEVTLTYTLSDKNQTGCQKTDTFTLAGWWEYNDISPVHYMNISKEYADSIEAEAVAAGLTPFRMDLNVMMASSIDIRGQMEQVDSDLGYSWEDYYAENSVRIGVNWGYTSAQVGERIDIPTILAIVAFLTLVIFTGYLIIYNIFQISVTSDIRFYGLLKTIGVTPRQLRRIIRQQALLLCLIGIPAGLLSGYGVGAVLTPVVMNRMSLSRSSTTLSVSPLIFLLSALFALFTVLLSCFRPGRIAAKVSPVEATKYTDIAPYHSLKYKRRKNLEMKQTDADAKCQKPQRQTPRYGAKVHQMAFANLGRNKSKTALVVLSLSLSLVMLNILITFVKGFDMEKYLAKNTCADFLVSGTDYFRFSRGIKEYISPEAIASIHANVSLKQAGSGYTLPGMLPSSWITEDAWLEIMSKHASQSALETALPLQKRRGERIQKDIQIEGIDPALFEKIEVIEGSLEPLFEENSTAIALEVSTDDYGNVILPESFPAIGDALPITYILDGWYIDRKTGEKCDENTPEEDVDYYIADSRDVEYTICAYVIVPYSMSFRYHLTGYRAILPVDTLNRHSGQNAIPMFYLFDASDRAAEEEAERYLAQLTGSPHSSLMYESKATVRAQFKSFQNMFLILGSLLCAIIGFVGVLNFFNAVMTGILSRKREFAVLQSVGMTNRQLKTMLVYEGLLYSLGAAAAALVISLPLNPLAGHMLENVFWFFRARFTILPVLLAVPVFAFLGWLIPSLMYGQATKQSIVERLREAE